MTLQERATRKLAEVEQKMLDLATIRYFRRQVIAARCDSLSRCTCQDCPIPIIELAQGDLR